MSRQATAKPWPGRKIEVTAEVRGLAENEPVMVRWQIPAGIEEVELTWDKGSGRFVGNIQLQHSASGVVSYYVVAGDDQEGPFRLKVKNVPVVALQSVYYQPPAYTGEVPHTSSSGAITAIDGTVVTIKATTNRPVAKATLEFNPKLSGEKVFATAGTRPIEIDSGGTELTANSFAP